MRSKVRLVLMLFVLAMPLLSTTQKPHAQSIADTQSVVDTFNACVNTAGMFYGWCIQSASTFGILRVPMALACGEKLATDREACEAASEL